MKILVLLLTLICFLTACAAESTPPSLPADALFAPTADPAAAPVSPPPETTAAETEPPETEPPAPVMLLLPDGMESDLTDPAAGELLAQIAALAAEAKLSAVCMLPDGTVYYAIGADEKYPAASTLKPPFCQYLLDSKKDLTEEIPLGEITRPSSSGLFTDPTAAFPAEMLMEYAVRYSDSMAYLALHSHYGAKGFNAWLKTVGITGLRLPNTFEYTDITARQLSILMAYILRRAEESGDTRLTDWMKNTTFPYGIAQGTDHKIAQKYGFEGGNLGFHHTAVIFADPPYILTVMSHLNPNTDDITPFEEITRLSDALHRLMQEK